MVQDLKVSIAVKDGGTQHLIVNGSLALVIDLLRELGREVIAERERSAQQAAQPPTAPQPTAEEAQP